MKHRILVVEDEENLLEGIRLNLELEGNEVVGTADGKKAIDAFNQQRFDLVVLDVMLPGIDGFTVCERIRLRDADVPVLFLTAKDSAEDRVTGLKLGADDYLTKPFNLDELLLRVKALLKRGSRPRDADHPGTAVFKFGDNEINFNTFEAKGIGGQTFRLTKREAAFLKILVERRNEVVSRQHILQVAWGYDVMPTTRTIDNFILTFRKYFESDSRNPKHFFSIRGVGYQFKE
ncbi:MAG TPA: response regulator transcription factor [Chitinophagales bacterium]|nr:response regulator transcription factor [Chitinophagales bacterium]